MLTYLLIYNVNILSAHTTIIKYNLRKYKRQF